MKIFYILSYAVLFVLILNMKHYRQHLCHCNFSQSKNFHILDNNSIFRKKNSTIFFVISNSKNIIHIYSIK